jgi:hypothetical protein
VTRIPRPGGLSRRLLRPAAFLLAALALAGGPPTPGRAAEAKALPADLALVPADGAVFITIRAGDLANGKAGKELLTQLGRDKDNNLIAPVEKYLGAPLADVERVTLLPAEDIVIVHTARPYDREKLLDAVAPKGQRHKYKDRTFYHNDATGEDVFLLDEQTYLRSHSWAPRKGGELKGGLHRLWDRPAVKDKALAGALQLAAAKHTVVVGLTPRSLLEYFTLRRFEDEPAQSVPGGGKDSPAKPPEDKPPEKKPAEKEPAAAPAQLTLLPDEPRPKEPSLDDLLRELPPAALPYKPLFQARLATLVGDLGDEAKVEVHLTFADKDAARDGEVSLRTALYVLRELLPRAFEEVGAPPEKSKPLATLLGQLQTALKTATVTQEGTSVSAAAHTEVEGAVVAALAQELSERGLRMRLANNMKQIILATINSADTNNGQMPTDIYSKDGKPLLSWRVAILPYIEQEPLYKEFHLDEPWDSDHNKKLMAKMPKVYAGLNARLNAQAKTVFLAPTGKDTAWPGGAIPLRFPASFTDGTSNTIFFVLADDEHAVEWTKPDDLKIDPAKPHAGLGRVTGRYLLGMGDGSVHWAKPTISKETLWAAFTRDANDLLGPDW